jgi:hypothetical protein
MKVVPRMRARSTQAAKLQAAWVTVVESVVVKSEHQAIFALARAAITLVREHSL